ncbi:ROK family protein [Pedobacter miscanthi]|uniref:ROK family protein n=1 Tax=Pedobacter miscanthi TaxID=2259170 RepID=UPI00293070E0|nr:ROK family protein [Pedobacter miscanthi]
MKNIVLGVDVGGSHITSSLIDLDAKKEIPESHARDRVDSGAGAGAILDAWAAVMRKSIGFAPSKLLEIGIAMPGPMDYDRGICYIKDQDKYRTLYGLHLKTMLAERLGILPSSIYFKNDAACFLKGEIFSGSLVGFEDTVGLTLGTGLGSAYTVNGEVEDAGLWQMPFLEGIAEDYLSTRWFVKRYFELSGTVVRDLKELVSEQIGSPHFTEIFAEFSYNLSLFLYKFIRKKNTTAAVIGGNIALAQEYFLEDTRKQLKEMMGYSFPVQHTLLGEGAALIGAGAARSPAGRN